MPNVAAAKLGGYMGYTHYWTFKTPKRGTTKQTNAAFERAITQCQSLVYNYNKTRTDETRLAGYTAHTKPDQYGGINFNGTAELGHEPFVVLEHYKDNARTGEFCKTNGKPYDVVVVACLCILKHYLGENFAVESDGCSLDWIAGLELARKSTGIKGIKMPSSIRTRIGLIG